MYGYLLLLIGSSFLYCSRNIIIKNYQLVKFKTPKLKVLRLSFKIVLRVIYISIIQKLNKNIKKISKNKYELTYSINGLIYKYRFKITRGPSKILQVIDDKNNDVTQNIVSYAGPSYNFHNIKYTPEDFNKNELTFNLHNGNSLTFGKNQIIELKL